MNGVFCEHNPNPFYNTFIWRRSCRIPRFSTFGPVQIMTARRKAGRCSSERWFRMWAITNGASRRSLAAFCWVEVKEALEDPSETLHGNRTGISTFDSVKLQPLMLAFSLPRSVFFSDTPPPGFSFMHHASMPEASGHQSYSLGLVTRALRHLQVLLHDGFHRKNVTEYRHRFSGRWHEMGWFKSTRQTKAMTAIGRARSPGPVFRRPLVSTGKE